MMTSMYMTQIDIFLLRMSYEYLILILAEKCHETELCILLLASRFNKR